MSGDTLAHQGPSFCTHSGQRNVLWEMFESPTVETGQTRTSKNILLIPLPQAQLCHAGYSSLQPPPAPQG